MSTMMGKDGFRVRERTVVYPMMIARLLLATALSLR